MRVTLKHVASQAGVSYQTVSKVINGQAQVSQETEARIWQVVKDLGYRPNYTARSLRSRRSYTIGYSWVPNPLKKYNPVLIRLLESMLQAAFKYEYYLLSFPSESDLSQQVSLYKEMINTGRVDGFVLSSVEYDDPRVLFLLEHDFPFVAFGRSNPDLQFPYVDVDGGLGVKIATEHLLEQGHRRIATIAWPEYSRVGNNRIEGYFAAMQAAGLSVDPDWVARAEGTFEFGYYVAKRLLALPADRCPTGFVCLSDNAAIGVVRAVQDMGLRVGADIAVTGFDDTPMIEYLDPPLTSVRQPIWEVGQRVIELLMTSMKEPGSMQAVGELVPPDLIVRSSSVSSVIV